MSVLIEGISVVVRAEAILASYPGGWEAFFEAVPNQTLCADGELVRVGFMAPDDVQAYIEQLEHSGLRFLLEGSAVDIVVVDQVRGPSTPCEWVEFGRIPYERDEGRPVAACRLRGSEIWQLLCPTDWTWEHSLSNQFGFVPEEHFDKTMTRQRQEDGLDVYRSQLSDEDVFIGRTRDGKSLKE